LTRTLGVGETWKERRAYALGQLLAEKEEAGAPVTVLEDTFLS
jgi:hypothetical protein